MDTRRKRTQIEDADLIRPDSYYSLHSPRMKISTEALQAIMKFLLKSCKQSRTDMRSLFAVKRVTKGRV